MFLFFFLNTENDLDGEQHYYSENQWHKIVKKTKDYSGTIPCYINY